MSDNDDRLRALIREAIKRDPSLLEESDEVLEESPSPSVEREVAAAAESAPTSGSDPSTEVKEDTQRSLFDPEEFDRLKKMAGDILGRSDAFIMIGVSTRDDLAEHPVLFPEAAIAARDATSLDTAHLQLPKLTSYVFENMVFDRMKKRDDEGSDAEGE